MDPEKYELYSRQIRFFGEENQEKLSGSKVAVVGAGGLGSHVAEMLVKMGFGFVRVIDRDLVEESNLPRVSLYTREDVGKPKALIIEEMLSSIDRDSRVDGVTETLGHSNIKKLLSGFDLVVDCTDNLEARHMINEFCIRNRVPWIYGSVEGDEGMCMSFSAKGKPCFECMCPRGKSPGESPENTGVVSPVVGIISSCQAAEAVAIVTGLFSGPSYGKLFRVRLGDRKFEALNVKAREGCGVCG